MIHHVIEFEVINSGGKSPLLGVLSAKLCASQPPRGNLSRDDMASAY